MAVRPGQSRRLCGVQHQAGRRLFIDGPGSMTKYSLATPGAPLSRHVDQHHEAFNKVRGDVDL